MLVLEAPRGAARGGWSVIRITTHGPVAKVIALSTRKFRVRLPVRGKKELLTKAEVKDEYGNQQEES